jgi:hypothetical protein
MLWIAFYEKTRNFAKRIAQTELHRIVWFGSLPRAKGLM